MTAPAPGASGSGSTLRLLTGLVLTMVAMATAVIGFSRLFGVLEAGGYGTSAMRNALVILGASGALFASGIATLIWEVSKRYERY
jgi:Na+-transporting NADH:ubiquinone oxidoreductase subunit NqrD